jgi:hypothetical protein
MCELQEFVAREQCDTFIELPVQSGLSSPKIVVIQRR